MDLLADQQLDENKFSWGENVVMKVARINDRNVTMIKDCFCSRKSVFRRRF